jgi:hypothetical protein
MTSLLPVLTVIVMAISPPCDAPETAVLDFWTGDWDVTWEGGKGHDRVTRSKDGCEIDDDFDTGFGARKRSYSVWPNYNVGWAMSLLNGPFPDGYQPSPLVYFTGRPVGSGYAFESGVAGTSAHRVLFSDIRKDSFTWHWQHSPDGTVWTDKLVARYVRSKP